MWKRLGLLEGLHRLAVQEVEPAALLHPHVADPPISIERHAKQGVAIPASVDAARRIPAAKLIGGMPMPADALLHPVHEAGVAPFAGVEERAVSFLDVVVHDIRRRRAEHI